jgi:serine/threonine protein kinase
MKIVHSLGIVHRDIKPENLMLTSTGAVQITDFGISIMIDDLSSNQSDSGDKNGTPLFSPPEACDGINYTTLNKSAERIYTPAPSTDFWALGVTLYALLHGHYPFQHDAPLKLSEMIISDEPCFSGSLSTEVRELLCGLMDKKPDTRIDEIGIRNHAWVSLNGPLITRHENTRVISHLDKVKVTRQATKKVSHFFHTKIIESNPPPTQSFKRETLTRSSLTCRNRISSSVTNRPMMMNIETLPRAKRASTGFLFVNSMRRNR